VFEREKKKKKKRRRRRKDRERSLLWRGAGAPQARRRQPRSGHTDVARQLRATRAERCVEISR
jgi:hypothetical protein